MALTHRISTGHSHRQLGLPNGHLQALGMKVCTSHAVRIVNPGPSPLGDCRLQTQTATTRAAAAPPPVVSATGNSRICLPLTIPASMPWQRKIGEYCAVERSMDRSSLHPKHGLGEIIQTTPDDSRRGCNANASLWRHLPLIGLQPEAHSSACAACPERNSALLTPPIPKFVTACCFP